ncbi:MAG: sigma-70 family RNA polymerase sigma factor [Planctomycetota bacterium]|jgi:RNA polymerase sigma factor (sigma-70 family)
MGLNMMKVAKDAKQATVRVPAKRPSRNVLKALCEDDLLTLEKLLAESPEYISHPDFKKRGTERRLFGADAKLLTPSATRFCEAKDPFAELRHAGHRITTLTAEQERHLFTRYNFARLRLNQILDAHAGRALTAKATRDLLAWDYRAFTTRGMIVRLNMPLVLAMAKRTRLANIDFNEMISEGNMALLRSVEKFDCSRGFKFSTYSCRAILKSFSRVAMRASRYRGYFPTEFDPAMERSDFTERQRENVERDCVDELKDILLENLAGLSQVEQTVITERFAIGAPHFGEDRGPKTLEQVGRIIGVTKERVRQIQNNALKKIKVALENEYLAA